MPVGHLRERRPNGSGRISSPTPSLLSVAKGIEQGTLAAHDRGSGRGDAGCRSAGSRALSGPNLALEIARGLPASSVVAAAEDGTSAQRVVEIIGTRSFRLYRNRDVIGVELCGALKNIIAIAAGAAEQPRFRRQRQGRPDHPRPGRDDAPRRGGRRQPADLRRAWPGWVTSSPPATRPLSRNHRLGVELATGRHLGRHRGDAAGRGRGRLHGRRGARRWRPAGVELPIAQEVHNALFEGKSVQRCLVDLLSREPKDELAGLEEWSRISSAG